MMTEVALERWSKPYLKVTSVIFLITGLAKIISIGGTAPILSMVDSVWGIKMRFLLAIAGFWEFGLSIFLWLNPRIKLSHILVLWTALIFVLYRTALHLLGEDHLCPCLGTMTNWLVWLSPDAKENLLKTAIAWFLSGSLTFTVLIGLSVKNANGDPTKHVKVDRERI